MRLPSLRSRVSLPRGLRGGGIASRLQALPMAQGYPPWRVARSTVVSAASLPSRARRRRLPLAGRASTRRRSTPRARPASSRSTRSSAATTAQGSGFVVDRLGTILTNAHVITDVAEAPVDGQRRHRRLRRVPRRRPRDRPDRRLGPLLGRRRRPRRPGRSRGSRRCPSGPRPSPGSASPSRRSGARSGTSRRSASGSSRRRDARSTRSPPATPSPTRSRSTRRSTTATRAARSSTREGRVIGINAQIRQLDRQRRGRRLRDPDRHRAPRAPRARGERPGLLRLHRDRDAGRHPGDRPRASASASDRGALIARVAARHARRGRGAARWHANGAVQRPRPRARRRRRHEHRPDARAECRRHLADRHRAAPARPDGDVRDRAGRQAAGDPGRAGRATWPLT